MCVSVSVFVSVSVSVLVWFFGSVFLYETDSSDNYLRSDYFLECNRLNILLIWYADEGLGEF